MHMSSKRYFLSYVPNIWHVSLVSSVHAVCSAHVILFFFTLGMNLLVFNSVTSLYDVISAQMDMCLLLYSYNIPNFSVSSERETGLCNHIQ
jgi:hypothetical protein